MVSTYGYITIALLEDYIGLDLSTIDSVVFSDAHVDAIITSAEEIINAYIGVSTAQTSTNGLVVCTKAISAKLVFQIFKTLGYDTNLLEAVLFINMPTKEILDTFLGESGVGADSIPMSGANNNLYNWYHWWY